MDARCAKHQFEGADNFCRQCGHPFCVRCLVYPFGERKPPFCIPCALVASGVRSGKAPRASWRERRAQKRAAFAPAASQPAAEPIPLDEPLFEVPAATAPAVDPAWSQPLTGDDPWFKAADHQPSWATQPATEPTSWSPSQASERSW